LTLFDNQNALVFAALFIAPGFIIHWFVSLVAVRQYSEQQVWLRLFVLSLFNAACFGWVLYVESLVYWVRILLLLLAGPVLIGYLVLLAVRYNIVFRLLEWLELNPVHPTPTAWDWKFPQMSKPAWVVVNLKNGGIILGYYGKNSFAASIPEQRDIYIENIYNMDEDGNWVDLGKGVLVMKDEISSIEFKIIP